MGFVVLIKPILVPIFVGIFVIWAIKILFSAKKEKKKYHPYGGTIFHLLLNFNNLYDYLTDLTRKNLTFRIVYHDNTEIYTSDPANIEYFLKTNFANYGKVTSFLNLVIVGNQDFNVLLCFNCRACFEF